MVLLSAAVAHHICAGGKSWRHQIKANMSEVKCFNVCGGKHQEKVIIHDHVKDLIKTQIDFFSQRGYAFSFTGCRVHSM